MWKNLEEDRWAKIKEEEITLVLYRIQDKILELIRTLNDGMVQTNYIKIHCYLPTSSLEDQMQFHRQKPNL